MSIHNDEDMSNHTINYSSLCYLATCRKFHYRFEELLKEPKAFAACALNTNWW